MQREVGHPTAADFPSLGLVHAEAFSMKQPLCCRVCCMAETTKESGKESAKVHSQYEKTAPQKLEHCGVVRDAEGKVLGACQLQLPGDPGDLHIPFDTYHLLPGEVHLEWIGIAPEAQGKGVGSTLLAWASETARASGATVLSLEVMAGNPRALALYERKGFVVKSDPHKDPCAVLVEAPFIFCCLGCQYCRIIYMEKPLA